MEDVVKEALYKKAKYLATVEKESISSAVDLSCEEVLKRIVQEAGGALKTVSTRAIYCCLTILCVPECLIIRHVWFALMYSTNRSKLLKLRFGCN